MNDLKVAGRRGGFLQKLPDVAEEFSKWIIFVAYWYIHLFVGCTADAIVDHYYEHRGSHHVRTSCGECGRVFNSKQLHYDAYSYQTFVLGGPSGFLKECRRCKFSVPVYNPLQCDDLRYTIALDADVEAELNKLKAEASKACEIKYAEEALTHAELALKKAEDSGSEES